MVKTHCDPSVGLPVPNVSTNTVSTITPSAGFGVGAIRGVVILLHGLSFAGSSSPPMPITNGTGIGAGFFELLTFANDLAADGWVVVQPSYQEDNYVSTPANGLYNDVNADAGNGADYVASTLQSITHYIQYVQATYPPKFPIVAFGFSEGAYKACLWAANMQSSILAFGAHCLPTTWENLSTAFTAPAKLNFGLLNWSGMDLGPTALNGVTIPGIVGFGTNDSFVGYSGTSTYTGANIDVTTLNNSSLAVSSLTGYIVGPTVTVTGLTGGAGRAVISFTGASGGNLTGCNLVTGSGTLASGTVMLQNNTQLIIANAPANVVGHSTSDSHVFTTADATYYSGTWFVNVVDPLAPKVF